MTLCNHFELCDLLPVNTQIQLQLMLTELALAKELVCLL